MTGLPTSFDFCRESSVKHSFAVASLSMGSFRVIFKLWRNSKDVGHFFIKTNPSLTYRWNFTRLKRAYFGFALAIYVCMASLNRKCFGSPQQVKLSSNS